MQFVTEATKYLLKLILVFDSHLFSEYKYVQISFLGGGMQTDHLTTRTFVYVSLHRGCL